MDKDIARQLVRKMYEAGIGRNDARLADVAARLNLVYEDQDMLDRRLSEFMDNAKYLSNHGDIVGGIANITLYGSIMVSANKADDDFIRDKLINPTNAMMNDDGNALLMSKQPIDTRIVADSLAEKIAEENYDVTRVEREIRSAVAERINFLENVSRIFQFQATALEFFEHIGSIDQERVKPSIEAVRKIKDEGYSYMMKVVEQEAKLQDKPELMSGLLKIIDDSGVDYSLASSISVMHYQLMLMVGYGFAPFEVLEKMRMEIDGIVADSGYQEPPEEYRRQFNHTIDTMRDVYWRSQGWHEQDE